MKSIIFMTVLRTRLMMKPMMAPAKRPVNKNWIIQYVSVQESKKTIIPRRKPIMKKETNALAM